MSHLAFASFGNVTVDDLVFADGTTMWYTPGGNAIYSALGMAIWGHRPAAVAPIGPDYPVEVLEGRLVLDYCRRTGRTLRDWGLYEEDGTRTFVFRSYTRDWLEYSPTLEDVEALTCDHAHIAPVPWQQQIAIADKLRSRGTRTISIDLDDRYLTELVDADRAQLLGAADLFLPSKQDAEALYPGNSIPDAIRRMRDVAPDVPMIAVKLGSGGVLFHGAGDAELSWLPAIAETVRDTTGAGDAFCGGALAGFVHGGTALEAALRGSVAGSFAVQSSGPGALVSARDDECEARRSALLARLKVRPL